MLNINRVDHRRLPYALRAGDHSATDRAEFSDGQYEGCNQALAAAEACRDALLQTHPPFSKPDYCAILKKNNRCGISGLTRVDRWELRVERACQFPTGRRAVLCKI